MSELKKYLNKNKLASELFEDNDYMNTIKVYLEEEKLLQNPSVLGKTIIDVDDNIVRELLMLANETAKDSTRNTNIKFGTSGWRGIIGKDFTYKNVAIATKAVIALLKDSAYKKETGLSFADVQEKGVLIGRDTRFLGKEFLDVAIGELHAENIKVFNAEIATTPELSATVVSLGVAGSINLTPSHNPFTYAGFKFNPSDGGPAEGHLTEIITNVAADLMDKYNHDNIYQPLPIKKELLKRVDAIEEYLQFISQHESPIKNIENTMHELKHKTDLKIVINVVGGAAASFERLFKKFGVDKNIVEFVFSEPDITFRGGMDTEPRSNLESVKDILKASDQKIKLGFVFDPDGDRMRFYDGTLNKEIEMNYFLGIVYYFEKEYLKLTKGYVAKTVATSNFLNALVAHYAEDQIIETPVGFKFFRGKEVNVYNVFNGLGFLVAGEESDGMSVLAHTFEKDGFSGVLMALLMFVETGKTFGQLLNEAIEIVGNYYPARGGIEVTMQGEPLIQKLSALGKISLGEKLQVGSEEKTVEEIIKKDGHKIVFTDKSWFMVRPSGTEPKVRFYIETRNLFEVEPMFKLAEEKTLQALA